jgi:hypothetical protein
MRVVWDLRSEPDIQLCGVSMNIFDIATFLQVIIMTGSGAGKRFVTNARWCWFFVSIWVLMHVDTKTMHRVTDKIRAELAPWVRDPPKLVSLS